MPVIIIKEVIPSPLGKLNIGDKIEYEGDPDDKHC